MIERSSIYALMTNDGILESLVRLLESGEPIPPDLADASKTLLRDALKNQGKIRLKDRGRPSTFPKAFEQACEVARLKLDGALVKQAVAIIAEKHNKSVHTVAANYKEHGKVARKLEAFIDSCRKSNSQ